MRSVGRSGSQTDGCPSLVECVRLAEEGSGGRKDQQRLKQGPVFAGKLRARAKAAKAKGRGADDLDFVAV